MESLDGIHSSQRLSVVDKVMRLLTAVCNFNYIKFTANYSKRFMNLCSFQASCGRAVEDCISLGSAVASLDVRSANHKVLHMSTHENTHDLGRHESHIIQCF